MRMASTLGSVAASVAFMLLMKLVDLYFAVVDYRFIEDLNRNSFGLGLRNAFTSYGVIEVFGLLR